MKHLQRTGPGRRLMATLLGILCLWLATAAGAEGDDSVRFTATVTRNLTVRKTKKQDAPKVATVEQGEVVHILALEKDWALIDKEGTQGYIVGKYFADFMVLDETAEIPDMYRPLLRPPYVPMFSGRVQKTLSLRADPDSDAKLLATLYDGERVELGAVGEEWTMARKGKKIGFVLSEMLSDFEVIDPYQAILAGVKHYPYAAVADQDLELRAAGPGTSGEALQRIPAGAVFPVSEPDEGGNLRAPFMRTIGALPAAEVELLPVILPDGAQPGDLLAVFSTFFTTDTERTLAQGRRYNIELGVRYVNNAVVEAGGRFSFNTLAGPYTKGNGYQLGPIINYTSSKKDGYGGGVCQVSTTLYNAVIQLPFKMVRARPHSSYGIEYAPVNFDCAVGAANQDFIFESKLPYAVRIQLDVWDGVVCARIFREGQLEPPVLTEPADDTPAIEEAADEALDTAASEETPAPATAIRVVPVSPEQ